MSKSIRRAGSASRSPSAISLPRCHGVPIQDPGPSHPAKKSVLGICTCHGKGALRWCQLPRCHLGRTSRAHIRHPAPKSLEGGGPPRSSRAPNPGLQARDGCRSWYIWEPGEPSGHMDGTRRRNVATKSLAWAWLDSGSQTHQHFLGEKCTFMNNRHDCLWDPDSTEQERMLRVEIGSRASPKRGYIRTKVSSYASRQL